MAAVEMTADMPMTPQDMWDLVSDLSDLGDWLVLHEGWRSEQPDEITEGTQIVGVARSKGLRNRVTWTVTKWDPPHQVAMFGLRQGRREIRRHAHRAVHQRRVHPRSAS
jgi:hypothetical protein